MKMNDVHEEITALDLIADHVAAPVHPDLTAAPGAEPQPALLARAAQLQHHVPGLPRHLLPQRLRPHV